MLGGGEGWLCKTFTLEHRFHESQYIYTQLAAHPEDPGSNMPYFLHKKTLYGTVIFLP